MNGIRKWHPNHRILSKSFALFAVILHHPIEEIDYFLNNSSVSCRGCKEKIQNLFRKRKIKVFSLKCEAKLVDYIFSNGDIFGPLRLLGTFFGRGHFGRGHYGRGHFVTPYTFWGHFGRGHNGRWHFVPLTLFGDILGGDILDGDILSWIRTKYIVYMQQRV